MESPPNRGISLITCDATRNIKKIREIWNSLSVNSIRTSSVRGWIGKTDQQGENFKNHSVRVRWCKKNACYLADRYGTERKRQCNFHTKSVCSNNNPRPVPNSCYLPDAHCLYVIFIIIRVSYRSTTPFPVFYTTVHGTYIYTIYTKERGSHFLFLFCALMDVMVKLNCCPFGRINKIAEEIYCTTLVDYSYIMYNWSSTVHAKYVHFTN